MLVYIPIIFSKSQIGFFSVRLMSAKETFLSVLRKQSCIHCGSHSHHPRLSLLGAKFSSESPGESSAVSSCTRLATHTIVTLSVKISLQTWPQVSHNRVSDI